MSARLHSHAYERGFTLIELLVVVAIIGILSSVVLAALSSARDQAKEAEAKLDLKSVKTEAEIYWSTNKNYGTNGANTNVNSNACTNANAMFIKDVRVTSALADADLASGGAGWPPTKLRCGIGANSASQRWVLWAPKATDATTGWCLDVDGNGRYSAAPASDGTYTCP
jgi:prepilin-type N-terminal cleavage/methylation domain-containing protein